VCVYYMPHPSHYPWFYHADNIWWSVQVMHLLIMQSHATSSFLDPNTLLNILLQFLGICNCYWVANSVVDRRVFATSRNQKN
jgi:hypothetical protein